MVEVWNMPLRKNDGVIALRSVGRLYDNNDSDMQNNDIPKSRYLYIVATPPPISPRFRHGQVINSQGKGREVFDAVQGKFIKLNGGDVQ